ncbi:MAG: hypothetical protein KF734_02050 [Saprospiraceae bacterium]|nr:hypothetical protein [Saprospiraceae bacterium]
MTSLQKTAMDEVRKGLQEFIDEVKELPKAFPPTFERGQIKAVVLGADPTNKAKNNRFDFVFDLTPEKPDSLYFKSMSKNLAVVGLSVQDVYVQNLVQNYCAEETSRNKQWAEFAHIWKEYLKQELDSQFEKSVPVFITAEVVFDVLAEKPKPRGLHYLEAKLVEPDENFLERTLIPMYRGGHGHYNFDKPQWSSYVLKIKELFGGE